MTKNKEQKPDEQSKTITLDFNKLSVIEKYKIIFLLDLHIRLIKAINPLAKYELPFFFEGYALLKQHSESGEKDISIRYETLPFIENKNPKEIFKDIDQRLSMLEIQDENIIDMCLQCLTSLIYLKRKNFQMTDDENYSYMVIEDYVKGRSFEALGYWTAKVKKFRTALHQETKKQQTAIKEKYVTEAWLKMINNPTEKKILETLSQNKIAKRIQERVMPDLKSVKTKTGKDVLTRSKKTDKEGKPILSGLSIRTIISIMQKQDKFNFNPFKE